MKVKQSSPDREAGSPVAIGGHLADGRLRASALLGYLHLREARRLEVGDDVFPLHGEHYRRTDVRAQAMPHRRADYISQSPLDNAGMETIGKRIKLLRTSRRLTQTQLAQLLGVKQNTISDLERGESETMTASTLEAICRVLMTTPGFVLYGTSNGTTHESMMQEAEIMAIFRELPEQAQAALVNNARLLREAIPARSASQPLITRGIPTPAKPAPRHAK